MENAENVVIEPRESEWIKIKGLPTRGEQGELRIAARSGLTAKKKLAVNPKARLSDQGYEICVTNHSDDKQMVQINERIAQAVMHKKAEVKIKRIEKAISISSQRLGQRETKEEKETANAT